MRKSAFLTTMLFASMPAMAADLAPKPLYKAPVVFSWVGAYVGFNGGFGWENTQTLYSYSSIPAPAPPGFQDIFGPGGPLNIGGMSAVGSAITQGFLPAALGQNSARIGMVGGQVGYNYQIAQYVLGVEADIDHVGGVKSTSFTAPINGIITNNASQTAGLEWLGTVRARAGFAYDRALFFATGGLAYGQATAASSGSGTDGFGTDTYTGSASGMRTGYAVGGGVEYAFTNYLTAKAEYLYYNLGTATYSVAAANAFTAGEGLFINASQKFDGSMVRFGLNYRLGW